ncbi:MAG: isoleucine--tRNA ligase [Holosporales bacterium]|jgi:isoleucyl-tRNA synthetase|nr:isoleucine--tRNA ligase [Holosporales bacterium]
MKKNNQRGSGRRTPRPVKVEFFAQSTDLSKQHATGAASGEPQKKADEERVRNSVLLPKTDFPMKANLQKKEPEILDFWASINIYKRLRAQSKGRKKFVLHYGPPYANGAIHTGHALTECLKDVVNKTKQMSGFDAPLVPGWDCHGLPIEWKIEEELRKSGKNKDNVPVIDFIGLCRDFANKWIQLQREGLMRFGICADWDDFYSTMYYQSEGDIVAQCLKLFMLGYIYRGKKPVIWSVVEQTALAEAEVEYQDHTSDAVYVMFPIKSSNIETLIGGYAVIWTTTPWTLPANRAICFHEDATYCLILVEKVDVAHGESSSAILGKKLLIAKDLCEDFCKKARIVNFTVVKDMMGKDLNGTVCRHPFSKSARLTEGDRQSALNYDFDVPLIFGSHVTVDAGTGLVHTAPGHGLEDFLVWKGFIPDVVEGDGRYASNLPLFARKHIFKVADDVIDVLREVECLAAADKISHSYPHSWRSKSPLIYRLTSQWFFDFGKIRDATLAELENVKWYPKQSINRIRGMVESRPDWCLSRQRVWGVPIALFVHKESKEPLRDEAVNSKIVETIKKEGIEAWYKYDVAFFIGQERAPEYEKVFDTLDVWFDSACTNQFVLRQREELDWPADLYLEGNDQHRGWFQSSLIESMAINGKAPYKNVMSHGFILDQEGRKMSKSLGNVISCDDLIKKYGADVTRLWIVSTDNSEDVRIGEEIMKRQEDVYRRFRNTLRYLLGALHDFEKTEEVAYEELPELDKYILHLVNELNENHKKRIEKFDFSNFYSDLHVFCINDLSAFYFDIRKDVLYCDAKDSLKRRATRTVMNILFEYIVRWLAPVTSFTAEEAWLTFHKGDAKGSESVHEQLFFPVRNEWKNEELNEKWERVRLIRRVVTSAVEQERVAKTISASLQASVVLFVEKKDAKLLNGVDMSEIAIVSHFSIIVAKPNAGAVTLDELPDVGAVVTHARGKKCQRCWKVVEDLSEEALCKRCFDVYSTVQ